MSKVIFIAAKIKQYFEQKKCNLQEKIIFFAF